LFPEAHGAALKREKRVKEKGKTSLLFPPPITSFFSGKGEGKPVEIKGVVFSYHFHRGGRGGI